MKKFLIITTLVLISAISGIYLYPQKSPRTYPISISDYDFYEIRELKKSNLTDGNYNTEGYVVDIYECSCPFGAQCEPCGRENIIISQNNNRVDYLSENDLLILVNNPRQFELGKYYRFSIEILDQKTILEESINDIELIGYNEMVQ